MSLHTVPRYVEAQWWRKKMKNVVFFTNSRWSWKKLWKIKMGLKNWILFRRNKNGDWNLISVVLMTMLSRLKSLPLARDDLRKWNLYQLQKEQVSHERGFYFIHLFGGLGEIRTKRWYVNSHFERNKPTEIKIFWKE